MNETKKYIIPALDLSKINKRIHKRSNSDTEILSNKTGKRKNIDDVIQKYKKTCLLIKEMHTNLEKIKKSHYDESELYEAIKEIKDKISNLEKEPRDTPRVLSRCDALVGNTRITLENTQAIIVSSKNIIKYLSTMDEEIEQHDMITVTVLNDILKEINDIKITLKEIKTHIYK